MAISKVDQEYFAMLARRIREGDADAFAELYSATYGELHRYAFYFLRDPENVHDALQEIYISVYKNIDKLKLDRLLIPWMRQIAYHTCCDFARQARNIRDMSVPLDDAVAQPRGTENEPFRQARDRDSWEKVRQALDRCPVKERQAFLLRYESGLRLEEIADFMGVSLASVKRYITAARAALQKDMSHLRS